MAVAEVSGEHGAVDDGFLHYVLGEALEHGVGHPYIGAVRRGVITGVFSAAGVIHPGALLGLPLVAQVEPVMIFILIEVTAPDAKAAERLSVCINTDRAAGYAVSLVGSTSIKIEVEPPSVAFDSHKYRVIGV